MNKPFDDFVEQISSLKSVNEKQAKKILIELLEEKENSKTLLLKLSKGFENINICIECNKITTNEDKICKTCLHNESNILLIIKNNLEYFNFEKILDKFGYNSLILNIKNKSDLIKFISFEENFNKLKAFINKNAKITEIIFAFSHTSENEILIDLIESNLDNKFKYFKLAHGLPSGNTVEYIDQETLISAIIKKEKI